MIESKFHNYKVSKLQLLTEAEGDKNTGDKKEEPTVKYKENLSIKEIPGAISAFKSYMGMFAEGMNCLDSVYGLALTADPTAESVTSFDADRRSIGVAAGKSEKSANDAWDKLVDIAVNLLNVIPQSIKKNDILKKYKEERAKLDTEYNEEGGKKMKKEYYDEEVAKLRKKYSDMIDPAQITSLTKMKEASDLYYIALGNFYKGAKVEADFIRNKAKGDETAIKDFFERVGEAMDSLVLSKKIAAKNIRTYESIDSQIIFEKTKDGPVGELDGTNLRYLADNLTGAILGLAKEIDNVIAYKKVVQGRETEAGKRAAEEAKNSASEMIQFVRDSYVYLDKRVDEILKDDKKTGYKELKERLDEISEKIAQITRKDGILEKWKNEVLGENREKTASGAYLEKGRELMARAKEIIDEITKSENLSTRIKGFEADQLLKRAVKAWKGEKDTTRKTSNIRRRGDYKTFPKNPTEKDKPEVKDFQERLKDLGQLTSGYKEGQFDDPTKEATKKAMSHLGVITGKVYGDSEEAFKDFLIDFNIYSDRLGDIGDVLKK
jgi:hypothetical protein